MGAATANPTEEKFIMVLQRTDRKSCRKKRARRESAAIRFPDWPGRPAPAAAPTSVADGRLRIWSAGFARGRRWNRRLPGWKAGFHRAGGRGRRKLPPAG